jgi:cytochrome c oxidase subunit IV
MAAPTTTDDHTGHAGAHTHPPDGHYIKIALALAALTAAETATYFVDIFEDNTALLLMVLMPIMIFKFGWVAYSFMHLGSDSRVFTRFFVTGIFLASMVYIIFLLTFDTFF